MNRKAYKDNLYKMLFQYMQFKEDPLSEKALGLTEEQNI